jgi:signal transduction histidine kinase
MPQDNSRAVPDAGANPPSSASLTRKVPLYIAAGLFVVLTAWLAVSYESLREASMRAGEERLVSVTERLAATYAAPIEQYADRLRTEVNVDAVVDFVRSRGTIDRSGAESAMTELFDARGLVHRIELFAADGTPLLALPPGRPGEIAEGHEELAADFTRVAVGSERATVAELRILDDTVVAPAVVAVLHNEKAVGYAVIWREMRSGSQGQEQLATLVGANAHLYLGNTSGNLWTDLTRTVPSPPVDVPPTGGSRAYTRPEQGDVIGVMRAIPGSPWSVLVEFSEAEVLAPATRFLQQSALVGLLLLIGATVLASNLSRRITRPLTRLTAAATSVAQGKTSEPLRIERSDEIGQLSSAFNTMAANVEDARRALEEKVAQRTAQLQERNDELEAFAHSISHDLRAPLRAMHGFSQALLADFGPSLDPVAADYASRIAAASHRMDTLIQDLLAYSRVSRTEVVLAPVDLGRVTRDAIAQLEADIDAGHARIMVHEPLPAVLAHRPILEQVVANLVANGLKFVERNRTPEIHVRAEQYPGWVRLWVEDNGIGIEPEFHQRIFSVFERLHRSGEFAGTGIGLAIVRKGAERMGGRVGVESTPGRGSRFWIELQQAEAA